MKNIFGEKLDSNGYAPSILSAESACFFCQNSIIARHEIFHGSYRQKAKAYGLWINVCPSCHNMIHNNPELDKALKRIAQNKAMEVYGWDIPSFIKYFGKNYREE